MSRRSRGKIKRILKQKDKVPEEPQIEKEETVEEKHVQHNHKGIVGFLEQIQLF